MPIYSYSACYTCYARWKSFLQVRISTLTSSLQLVLREDHWVANAIVTLYSLIKSRDSSSLSRSPG